jgi:hypothetical protein
VSPILHVIFTHAQPLRYLDRANVSPFECSVKACSQSAPEVGVPDATFEVSDIFDTSVHID